MDHLEEENSELHISNSIQYFKIQTWRRVGNNYTEMGTLVPQMSIQLTT